MNKTLLFATLISSLSGVAFASSVSINFNPSSNSYDSSSGVNTVQVSTSQLGSTVQPVVTLPDDKLKDMEGNDTAWTLSILKVTGFMNDTVSGAGSIFSDAASGSTPSFVGSNNGAAMKFVIGGLQAGGVYNLSVVLGGASGGGNSWLQLDTDNFETSSTATTNIDSATINADNGKIDLTASQFTHTNTVDWANVTADADGNISIYSYSPTGNRIGYTSLTITSVPEPVTSTLSLLGLAALMMRRRRA